MININIDSIKQFLNFDFSSLTDSEQFYLKRVANFLLDDIDYFEENLTLDEIRGLLS